MGKVLFSYVNRIDEFVFNLREFVRVVKVEPPVHNDCTNIINSFAMALTLFTKFEEMWEKVGFRDRYRQNFNFSELFRKIVKPSSRKQHG